MTLLMMTRRQAARFSTSSWKPSKNWLPTGCPSCASHCSMPFQRLGKLESKIKAVTRRRSLPRTYQAVRQSAPRTDGGCSAVWKGKTRKHVFLAERHSGPSDVQSTYLPLF